MVGIIITIVLGIMAILFWNWAERTSNKKEKYSNNKVLETQLIAGYTITFILATLCIISICLCLGYNNSLRGTVKEINRDIEEISSLENNYKIKDTFIDSIENKSDTGYVDSVMAMLLKEKLEVNKKIVGLQGSCKGLIGKLYLYESTKTTIMALEKME